MGLRGPRRKDNAEQIALGDPGKRAKRRQEKETACVVPASPDIEVMRPCMPDYLTDEAKEHWNFLVPQLEQAGIIRAIDVDLLGDYCQCMGKAIKYERYCTKNGDYVQKSNNAASKVLRPEVKWIREFRKEANKLADKLGLTPKARDGMGINIKPPPSADEQAKNATIGRFTKR